MVQTLQGGGAVSQQLFSIQQPFPILLGSRRLAPPGFVKKGFILFSDPHARVPEEGRKEPTRSQQGAPCRSRRGSSRLSRCISGPPCRPPGSTAWPLPSPCPGPLGTWPGILPPASEPPIRTVQTATVGPSKKEDTTPHRPAPDAERDFRGAVDRSLSWGRVHPPPLRGGCVQPGSLRSQVTTQGPGEGGGGCSPDQPAAGLAPREEEEGGVVKTDPGRDRGDPDVGGHAIHHGAGPRGRGPPAPPSRTGAPGPTNNATLAREGGGRRREGGGRRASPPAGFLPPTQASFYGRCTPGGGYPPAPLGRGCPGWVPAGPPWVLKKKPAPMGPHAWAHPDFLDTDSVSL